MRDEDSTMTNRTPRRSPSSPAPAERARWPFGRAGGVHLYRQGSRDRERSRRLPPASSDRDRGSQPLDRDLRRSWRAAACPLRNAPTSWDWRRSWVREGTGAIVADVPVDTPNARAAASYLPGSPGAACGRRRAPARNHDASLPSGRSPDARDDQAELSKDRGGCRPLRSVAGGSRALDPGQAAISKTSRITISAAPTQRNLAAMIDNPADLVQPRPETPAYTARRTAGFEKYRKGDPTATVYPEAEKAKLSDTGK